MEFVDEQNPTLTTEIGYPLLLAYIVFATR